MICFMRSLIGFIVFLSVTLGVFAGVITPLDVFLVDGEEIGVAKSDLSKFKDAMSRDGKKAMEVEIYDVEGRGRLRIGVDRRDVFMKAIREHGIRFERRIVFSENGKVNELPEGEMRNLLQDMIRDEQLSIDGKIVRRNFKKEEHGSYGVWKWNEVLNHTGAFIVVLLAIGILKIVDSTRKRENVSSRKNFNTAGWVILAVLGVRILISFFAVMAGQ